MSLDLRPFGVNFILRPGINTIDDIFYEDIADGLITLHNSEESIDPRDFFRIDGVKYTHLKRIGAGTYGTTYRALGSDGRYYAIKRIKHVEPEYDIVTLMKECIQQIIIVKHTKDLPNGPYAPILYKIGYDSENKDAFIVSELMDNTLWNLISSRTIEENDIVIPNVIAQLAKELQILQKDLKFNHRDLKSDNVMYKTKPDGSLNVKFIDFGFTCLTWNGMFINGGEYFKYSKKCFRPVRDIVQLITSILYFHSYVLSKKLKDRLNHIISTKHRTRKQKLTTYMKDWVNSYKLLDRNNYVVEAGDPKTVYDEMIRFQENVPFRGVSPVAAPVAPAAAVICPPDKIMNPATGRCVLRTGAIGRKLAKEIAAPAVAVEAAPAVPAPAAAPVSDGCPPGKIRNPKTRRCVKRDGAIGKKLL